MHTHARVCTLRCGCAVGTARRCHRGGLCVPPFALAARLEILRIGPSKCGEIGMRVGAYVGRKLRARLRTARSLRRVTLQPGKSGVLAHSDVVGASLSRLQADTQVKNSFRKCADETHGILAGRRRGTHERSARRCVRRIPHTCGCDCVLSRSRPLKNR